jgi:hypothetical protein
MIALLLALLCLQDPPSPEASLAKLLFHHQLSGIHEWHTSFAAMKEVTDNIPEGEHAASERPWKKGAEFWFVLRLEPMGDVTAGWTRVFKLAEKDKKHSESCYCKKCHPNFSGESYSEQFEDNEVYMNRVLKDLQTAWFNDALEKYKAELVANEKIKKETPYRPVLMSDVADIIMDGKTRLYRIPHAEFDLSTLRRTLLVW